MSVVVLPQVMNPAFKHKYGVAAFNAVDDITLDGLISAAEESKSPLIVQISVKTFTFWGGKVIKDTFTTMAERVSVPITLHLDHCPDPEIAKESLEIGWNSVLFDGSALSFDENFRITKEIVAFATQFGAHVEGEVVAVTGVEDGVGSESEGELIPIEKEVEFIKGSGIYCYAPPIGTAHGFYKSAPEIRFDRMRETVELTGTPMVLHGGSGLTDDVYRRLIALGAAKVNISTDLKKTYADGFRTYLEAKPTEYNPLKLIGAVRDDVKSMARHYFRLFGSEGRG
ncbi:MAG: class II fructose-bisphosphate aldolase [Spirochaetaceae bacterium]|nr:MAG: class II fructose-bisphosphate aldolase [Spirochaetaceae bacterium]